MVFMEGIRGTTMSVLRIKIRMLVVYIQSKADRLE